MEVSPYKKKRLIRAFLLSLSLLICLDLLFMYIIYLRRQDFHKEVTRPNFSTLLKAYEKAQLNYADAQNHVWLVERGYEKIDTKAEPFDFSRYHGNWAYPPLYPTLASMLNFTVRSPFWSLWIINQIVLLLIFIGFYYWSATHISGYEGLLSAWIILLFFILTPLCYFVNFIILPVLLLGIIFFSLRKWLSQPEEHHTAFWILAAASLLIGFSRFQGMLLNASLLFLIIIIIIWYKKPLEKTKIAILSSANILPFIGTMGIFKYYANDPLAWAKIEKGWGMSPSWPWTPIVRYWESGLVLNLFSDDLFFTTLRLLIFLIFGCLAAKIIILDKKFMTDFISRRYSDSFISLFFVAISLGLLILPFVTGILVGAIRKTTLAFLVVIIWFEQGRRMNIFVILSLLFLSAVGFSLFFLGVKAFIW
jgi:hypothetical protein